MTRLDHHRAVLKACESAYIVRVLDHRTRLPEEVWGGGQELIDSYRGDLPYASRDALGRCRDKAYDAGHSRDQEKRAERVHAACDAYYAAVGVYPEAYRRFLVAGAQREL